MQKIIKGASLTDIGLKRNKNEDAASVSIEEDYCLAIVADGIGGHRKGEVASDMTIGIVSSHLQNVTKTLNLSRVKKVIKTAIKDANKEINNLSVKPDYLDMGTTLVLSVVLPDQTYVANIGDSRLYTFSQSKGLEKVTVDHTYVEYMVRIGKMTREQALNSPQKNVLLNAIGINPSVYYDDYVLDNNYDALLLCSDGLYNMVSEEEIVGVLSDVLTSEEKCRKLVDLANSHGGVDNIGISLLEVK